MIPTFPELLLLLAVWCFFIGPILLVSFPRQCKEIVSDTPLIFSHIYLSCSHLVNGVILVLVTILIQNKGIHLTFKMQLCWMVGVTMCVINYCKLKMKTLKICFLTFCTQIPGFKCLEILSLIGRMYVISITNFMSQNYNMFSLIVTVLAA